MPDREVIGQFRGLTQALDKIFYETSRTDDGSSVFPDIFGATHGMIILPGGCYHPLAALMAISLIRDKVHKDRLDPLTR